MPANFQKTINKTLEGCKNYFDFLDTILNILITTKGKINDPEETLIEILNRLYKEGPAISLQISKLPNRQECWGFKITPNGVSSPISKTESLKKPDPQKALKQLRSLMGSIRHLIKVNSAELSEPLSSLLRKNNTTTSDNLKWEQTLTNL